MQKIKTVFVIDRDTDLAKPEVHPASVWYQNADSVATIKRDGRACAVINGQIYVRYDRKIQDKYRHLVGTCEITEDMLKPRPENGVPCEEAHDPKTGHHPFWVPPNEAWIIEAFQDALKSGVVEDGTYELVGPKVRCNIYGLAAHKLFKHGGEVVEISDRSFEGLKAYLSQRPEIEGLVFHKLIDDVLHYAKVRQKDFGFAWNLGAEGVRSPRKGKRV